MKALSIHPYYALLIFGLEKTVECRTWQTAYRGDLLICSTAKKLHGTIPGHALCVVTLADIEPFTRRHLDAACMQPRDFAPGMYAWHLQNVRIIKPIPLKGKLGLWEYEGPIDFLEVPASEKEQEALWDEWYEPLVL